MKTPSQAIARPPAISSLGLICAAQFVLQLDFSIVNVALPTIQRDLGFAPADLQWVVTGYALTFGAMPSRLGPCSCWVDVPATCWGGGAYLCWGSCS
jgi:MFS family permease